jgi:hypothetical protein
MLSSKKEPMVLATHHVHTTTDYFLFKPLDGNRTKNLNHINRLKKSMSEQYLFTVIIVNENYEIIDGQHRFDVIEELKLPLHYVVCKGYGLEEVHRLNQLSKNWNADDYMNGYCELGYKDYLQYRDFKNKYQVGHNECMLLLSGTHTNKNTGFFNTGMLKVKSVKDAEKIIEKIFLLEPYYDGYKRRTFVYTMYKLLNNPNFEFTEFIQKLKIQPTALQHCTEVDQYVALIEEIYNYKRRDKVNLRF